MCVCRGDRRLNRVGKGPVSSEHSLVCVCVHTFMCVSWSVPVRPVPAWGCPGTPGEAVGRRVGSESVVGGGEGVHSTERACTCGWVCRGVSDECVSLCGPRWVQQEEVMCLPGSGVLSPEGCPHRALVASPPSPPQPVPTTGTPRTLWGCSLASPPNWSLLSPSGLCDALGPRGGTELGEAGSDCPERACSPPPQVWPPQGPPQPGLPPSLPGLASTPPGACGPGAEQGALDGLKVPSGPLGSTCPFSGWQWGWAREKRGSPGPPEPPVWSLGSPTERGWGRVASVSAKQVSNGLRGEPSPVGGGGWG